MATAQAAVTNATAQATEHAQRADNAISELQAVNIENARLQGKSDTLAEQLTKAEATATTQAEQINKLTAQVAKLEQLERDNKELKRVIENAKNEQQKSKNV